MTETRGGEGPDDWVTNQKLQHHFDVGTEILADFEWYTEPCGETDD